MSEPVCDFCGAPGTQVGLMEDGSIWRCINEYKCAERENPAAEGVEW